MHGICLICRFGVITPNTSNANTNGIQISNPRPTSQVKEEVNEHLKRDTTRIPKKSEASESSPPNDKREDLTALKALDVLLRRYDRRSTPTNDLGKC